MDTVYVRNDVQIRGLFPKAKRGARVKKFGKDLFRVNVVLIRSETSSIEIRFFKWL